MQRVFDSIDVPDHELESFRQVTSSALVAFEIQTAERPSFAARVDTMALGAARIIAMSYPSLSSRRTSRLIRQSDPETYQIGLIRTGRQGIEQNRTRELVLPGGLVLYDSSRPFEAFVSSGTRDAKSVVLQFPKRLLPLPPGRVTRLLAVPLSATNGVGHLLTQLLTTLSNEDFEYTDRDALRLGHTAIDLVTAVLAHHLDGDTPPARSSTHLLYLQLRSFIDQNLHRPDLTPSAIASAHRISVRYLHRIFQEHHDTGVNAYIRTRRLNRCRRDLADPSLRHLTIAVIAARWGFTRPAEFSRTFRHETGKSPSEYRDETTPCYWG